MGSTSFLPAAASSVTIRPHKPELMWAHIIHSEIVNVTSTMRKNARWSIMGGSGMDYGSSLDSGGSSRSSKRKPKGDEYDYCRDMSAQGRDGLDAVLEFTNQVASSGRRDYLGSPERGGGGSGLQESTLLAGFTKLKARLTLLQDLRDLEPIHLLQPFLDIIRSGDTTGPITGAALTSVETFIKYKILDANHPGLPQAMSALTHSVTHCKFEATDAVSDEVVLAKILRLIRVTVMSEAGQKTLDDKGICEMVETGFGMCFQSRVSELLRRSAEQTLVVLVQALFERLSATVKAREHELRIQSLDLPTASKKRVRGHSALLTPKHKSQSTPDLLSTKEDDHQPIISIADGPGKSNSSDNLGANMITVGSESPFPMRASTEHAPDVAPSSHKDGAEGIRIGFEGNEGIAPSHVISSGPTHAPTVPLAEPVKEDSSNLHRQFVPYGLPAILELIRVLVTLIDPRNRNHTDTMHRVVALTLLQTGITVGGASLSKWVGWGVVYEKERQKKMEEAIAIRAAQKAAAQVVAAAEAKEAAAAVAVEKGEEKEGEAVKVVEEKVEKPKVAGEPEPEEEIVIDETEEEKMAIAAKELIVNELTKYLFQLLQSSNITVNSQPSTSSLTLLTLTIQVLTALFQTSRENLKYQFEWFLDWIMNKVNAGIVTWDIDEASSSEVDTEKRSSTASTTSPSSSSTQSRSGPTRNIIIGEARELLLETLAQFFRIPTFGAELLVNFDGDLNSRHNLYEETVRFITKHAFPDATPGGPATTSVHQTICIDTILMFLRHLVERGRSASVEQGESSSFSAESLRAIKYQKKMLRDGAERFNGSPKDAIKFLQTHNFLPDPAEPGDIAKFLKNTPGVSKAKLGEYIAKPANVEILKAFIKLFDFKKKRLDEALRLLLESFRLPGEAQQIDRILENFSVTYYESTQDEPQHEFGNSDSVFVLAFSMILLNSDQHNPQVRRKMTKEDFKRNARGCNNGGDFDPAYMDAIFEAIRDNEIVMPEEHEGDLGFSYSWRELMKKSNVSGSMITNIPKGIYESDMFSAVCVPVVAALSYAFDNAEDNLTLQKAVSGFHRCAMIASGFHLTDVVDSIISSLAKMTGLLKDSGRLPPERDLRSEGSDDKSKPAPKVDRWAVDFGRNYKSQVAAVLLFNLASEFGNSVGEGWKSIIHILSNLFLHGLLPISMLTADDFVYRAIKIPRIAPPAAKEKTSQSSSRKDNVGLFMTLTQLLSLSTGSQDDDEELDPTPDEIDAERFTLECIAACRIEELFRDSRFLEERSLKHLVSSITESSIVPLPGLTNGPGSATTIAQSRQVGNTTEENSKVNGTAVEVASSSQNPSHLKIFKYDPAAAFHLELILHITMQNRDRMKVLWPVVFTHIATMLKDPPSPTKPISLLEKGVVVLVKLIIRLAHKEDMSSHVFEALDMLLAMSPELMNVVSEQLLAGFVLLVKTDPTIFTRYGKWESILHFLSSTSLHPEAAKYSFELACLVINDNGDPPVTDNFGECVDLLISYATSAATVVANGSMPGEKPSQSESAKGSAELLNGRNDSGNREGSPRGRKPVVQKSVSVQNAVDRAVKALEKLFRLHTKVPKMIAHLGMGHERAWFEFWLPLLSGLGQQCYHPAREVRQCGLTLLQRALLSPELESNTSTSNASAAASPAHTANSITSPILTSSTFDTGVDCFENVLFPLLDELLKPDVFKLDPNGMDESRMRAAGGTEFLYEGILESMKNMLLVLSTQGNVFHRPGTAPSPLPPQLSADPAKASVVLASPHNLWDTTWQYLDQVLPGLKDELFPPNEAVMAKPNAPSVNGDAGSASVAVTQPIGQEVGEVGAQADLNGTTSAAPLAAPSDASVKPSGEPVKV
ncbi:GDP/GTP exchange factor for ARF [Chytridiales sp. JEL 0842]|nr:GDP/GTP exchange factor for ARF [Chytridiales sp. JEL 0842]